MVFPAVYFRVFHVGHGLLFNRPQGYADEEIQSRENVSTIGTPITVEQAGRTFVNLALPLSVFQRPHLEQYNLSRPLI